MNNDCLPCPAIAFYTPDIELLYLACVPLKSAFYGTGKDFIHKNSWYPFHWPLRDENLIEYCPNTETNLVPIMCTHNGSSNIGCTPIMKLCKNISYITKNIIFMNA